MRKYLILVLAVILFVSNAFALKTVDLKEGVTEFVEVSDRDLNALVFPMDVKVFTKSENIEVKVQEKRVFVSFNKNIETGEFTKAPEQLYFLSENKTYSMVLIPKGIPAETVIAKIESLTDKEEALDWEREQPYIVVIKSLIKAMYGNTPPNGYEMNQVDTGKDVSLWKGITQVMTKKVIGATFSGEVFEVSNNTNEIVRFREQEFYSDNVVAVSIDTHELQPKEKTELYVVKRLSSSNVQKGVFNVLQQ